MSTLLRRIEYYEAKTRQLSRMKAGRHRLRRLARLTVYKSVIDTAIVRYVRNPWYQAG
jgi:hypothetical protein